MAQGDKKRTYKVTKKAVAIINWFDDNSRLDKSDTVDRAVKYYYAQVKAGNIDDPMVQDQIEKGADELLDDDEDDSGSGLIDRIRGKK